jgi:hypothetical protein
MRSRPPPSHYSAHADAADLIHSTHLYVALLSAAAAAAAATDTAATDTAATDTAATDTAATDTAAEDVFAVQQCCELVQTCKCIGLLTGN